MVVHWGAVICSFSRTEVTCLVYLACAVLTLSSLTFFFFLYYVGSTDGFGFHCVAFIIFMNWFIL